MKVSEQLIEYSKQYTPLVWAVEGPYLFISSHGLRVCKEDNWAVFPSIDSHKQKELILEEGKRWIDNNSKFILEQLNLKKEERIIKLEYESTS